METPLYHVYMLHGRYWELEKRLASNLNREDAEVYAASYAYKKYKAFLHNYNELDFGVDGVTWDLSWVINVQPDVIVPVIPVIIGLYSSTETRIEMGKAF